MHTSSDVQLSGHSSEMPSQTNGEQLGPPTAPASRSWQTPVAHAWQAPSHALLQHTPSTQWPFWHSSAAPQLSPSFSFSAHTVPAQKPVAWQSSLSVQVVLQVPPTHSAGAQA